MSDTVIVEAPLGADIEPGDYQIPETNTLGAIHTTTEFDPNNLNQVTVDGYDSTDAPYDDDGDYDQMTGQIVSDGRIDLRGKGDIYGQAWATGSISTGGNFDISGEKYENEDIPIPENIDEDVEDTVSSILDTHNNAETETVQNDELTLDENDQLDSGIYHFDSLTVEDGETLTLDTAGGDIVLGVDGDVTVEEGGEIVVEGDADTTQTRLFATGDVDVNGDVSVRDDRSFKNFWYAPSDAEVDLGTERFVGLLFAPGAQFDIDGQNNDEVQVYGSLVGDFDTNVRHLDLHYDNALHDIGGEDDTAEIGDGEIIIGDDPELVSVTSEVSFLGSDFAVFDQPGDDPDRTSFAPDLEREYVDNPDGNLEELSYWEETTSAVSDDESFTAPKSSGSLEQGYEGQNMDELEIGEYGESHVDATDNEECVAWFFGCVGYEYWENVDFDGDAGEDIRISVEPLNHNDAELTLYGPDGTELASGDREIDVELPEDGTYQVEVRTGTDGLDYRLEISELVPETYYFEEIAFTADAGDQQTTEEATVEVESDETDVRIELFDDEGTLLERTAGSNAETLNEGGLDDGEYTIRVSSTGPETEFDYEIGLERSYIDNVPTYRQAPVTVDLVTDDGDTEDINNPWPEPAIDEDYDAGHSDRDLNHPAIEYPLTEEIEMEPGTAFSIQAEWRLGLCNDDESYAGTTRNIDGVNYAEFGCGSGGDNEFNEEIQYEAGEPSDRFHILEDGDEVPEVDPVPGQVGLQDRLGPRVDGDNILDLDDGEFVIVFELSDRDYIEDPNYNFGEGYGNELSWESALETPGELPAYNDMVMLYEITDEEFEDQEGNRIDPDETIDPSDLGEDYGYTVNISNDQIVIDAN